MCLCGIEVQCETAGGEIPAEVPESGSGPSVTRRSAGNTGSSGSKPVSVEQVCGSGALVIVQPFVQAGGAMDVRPAGSLDLLGWGTGDNGVNVDSLLAVDPLNTLGGVLFSMASSASR